MLLWDIASAVVYASSLYGMPLTHSDTDANIDTGAQSDIDAQSDIVNGNYGISHRKCPLATRGHICSRR